MRHDTIVLSKFMKFLPKITELVKEKIVTILHDQFCVFLTAGQQEALIILGFLHHSKIMPRLPDTSFGFLRIQKSETKALSAEKSNMNLLHLFLVFITIFGTMSYD